MKRRKIIDRRPTDFRSHPIRRITTQAEFGERMTAEAWRYRYAKYNEVYVQVKNATGDWATFRMLVPR